MKKSSKEIFVKKLIDDLKGRDEIVRNPRACFPDDVRDACNNIGFTTEDKIDPIENLTCQFFFRNLFFLMHQTGLYNPQRLFWNHLARTERVVIKDFKPFIGKKDQGKISDLFLFDSNNKFIQVRLEHPDMTESFSGFGGFFNQAFNNRCLGLMYIANSLPPSEILEKIRTRTNFQDDYDKYRSPLNDHCSFNLLVYEMNNDSLRFNFVHPDIKKTETSKNLIKSDLISSLNNKDLSLNV